MKKVQKIVSSLLLSSIIVGILPTATLEAYAVESQPSTVESNEKKSMVDLQESSLENSISEFTTRSTLDPSKFKTVSSKGTIGTLTDSYNAKQTVTFEEIKSTSSTNFSFKVKVNSTSAYLKDDFYKISFYTKSGSNLTYVGDVKFSSFGYSTIYLTCSNIPKNLFANQPYIYATMGVSSSSNSSSSKQLQFKVKNPFYQYKSTLKTFITDKASNQAINTKIKLTATANSSNTLYEFYVKDSSGNWTKLKGMGPKNYVYWTPTKAGAYTLRVRAKHEQSSEKYDSYKDIKFNIYQPSKVSTLTTNKPSGTKIGTKITVSAKTNSSSNNYCEFYVKDSSGKWTKLKGMGSKHYAYWTPTKPGKYTIRVRSKHKDSTKKYDSYKDITFTVK